MDFREGLYSFQERASTPFLSYLKTKAGLVTLFSAFLIVLLASENFYFSAVAALAAVFARLKFEEPRLSDSSKDRIDNLLGKRKRKNDKVPAYLLNPCSPCGKK